MRHTLPAGTSHPTSKAITVALFSSARQLKHRAFLARRDVGLRREARAQRAAPSFRSAFAEVQAGMRLPQLSSHQGPWAIGMVKNEADIIEASIRHLVAQGIDHLLIVDNMSEDKTPAILERLAKELPHLVVGRDTVPAYHQSEKMTFLADRVTEAGATWVIPFDADELWFSPRGTLADALANAAEPVQRARIHNLFPTPDGNAWRLDPTPHHDDKVAFTPWESAVIAMGNHEVARPGRRNVDALRIVHVPWRSFDQFARKTRVGAAAVALADLDEDKAYHWRRLGAASDAELHDVWENLLAGAEVPHAAWYPKGMLVDAGTDLPTRWESVAQLLDQADR